MTLAQQACTGHLKHDPTAPFLNLDPDGFDGRAGTGEAAPDARPVARLGRALRVLVVEDEAVIAMQIEIALEDAGIEVAGIASSADEAVELAGRFRPDLVTMDIRLMGERDGISAAVEIYHLYGIRSIFTSAYSDVETQLRGAEARPLDWISKPFRDEDLIQRITGSADISGSSRG